MSFPASSPESALRRCEGSQKHALDSAQAVDYLLALAADFRPAGSLVIPAGPESPMALKRSDSPGTLSAQLATVSVQVNPVSSVFHPVLSANRQAFRKVSRQAGLVERASLLQPLHLA